MWQYGYSDELYHYGVKGMKWGVRRAEKKAAKAEKNRQKEDAKFIRRNPKAAKIAQEKRADLIESKKRSIEEAKKSMKRAQELRDKDIDSIDFDEEARNAVKEQLSFLQEGYDMGYYTGYAGDKRPTESDAINDFFWSNGMEAPKGATIKDVAKVIRSDTEVLKKNKVYDKLIEEDKKYIAKGEQVIQAVQKMSLKEIYNNRSDIYYEYWKKAGIYD